MITTNLKQFFTKENIPHRLFWFYTVLKADGGVDKNQLAKKIMNLSNKLMPRVIVIHRNLFHILKKITKGNMMTLL